MMQRLWQVIYSYYDKILDIQLLVRIPDISSIYCQMFFQKGVTYPES